MPPRRERRAMSTPILEEVGTQGTQQEQEEEEVQSNPQGRMRQQMNEEQSTQNEDTAQSVEVGTRVPRQEQVPFEEMVRQWYEATQRQVPPVNPGPQGPSVAPIPVQVPPVPQYLEAVRGNAPTLGKYVKELKSLGCWAFAGPNDPEAVLHWINKVEATLEEAEIPEAFKVRAVYQLLEKNAQTWWGTVKTRYPTGAPIRWETFRAAFDEQYYTKTMIKGKEAEFLQLRQGDMSVIEYEQRFQELSLFAPRHIADEEERCDRFVAGLDPELKGVILTLKAMGKPLREIVEAAQVTERNFIDIRNKRNPQVPSKSAFQLERRKEFPIKSDRGAGSSNTKVTGKKRNFKEFSTNAPSRTTPSQAIPNFLPCRVCNFSHAGRCYVGEGKCFICRATNHQWRDCKKLPAVCQCCGLLGHREERCWRRTGAPSRAPFQVMSSAPPTRSATQLMSTGQGPTRTQVARRHERGETARVYYIEPQQMSAAGNAVTEQEEARREVDKKEIKHHLAKSTQGTSGNEEQDKASIRTYNRKGKNQTNG